MNKKKIYGMNIGASSMLLIVVILAMVCFASLSLASANADLRLCKKMADRTTEYYNATSEAYKQLHNAYETQKESPTMDNSFEINIHMNDVQVLIVSANINPDTSHTYSINTFTVANVNEPKMDNSLSLLLN